MPEGKIYVGTSGWNYKHWRGVFYPHGITIDGELAYYSGVFNASEINNSFYRLPRPSTVEQWVLIQLPSMLGYHKEKAEMFFKALKMYKGYRFALEPRHPGWMEEDAIRLLKKYHIGFVIAESGGRWPSGEFITARHIYIRFHGPNGYYDTAYPGQKLAAMAKKCRAWRSEGHTIRAFFNNDGHAYAVKNAMTFKRLIIRSPADADRWYG